MIEGIKWLDPITTANLATKVCAAIPRLEFNQECLNVVFNGSVRRMVRFIARHMKPKQWTDKTGVICQVGGVHVWIEVIIVRLPPSISNATFTS